MTAGGFLGLQKFVNLQSEELAEDANFQGYANEANIYGPLIKDPNRILDLPDGFSYDVLSKTGDPMTDGLRTPGAPDGMAAFEGSHGQIILVRNHELSDSQTFEGPYGIQNEKLPRSELNKFYDGGKGIRPQLGGTTTVVFDPQKRGVQKSFLSLAGTERNCAGGPTPWGSWISCEETVSLKDEYRECDHRYNFEVPATESMFLNKAEPIKAMGRFNHEAVAVDPLTGIVYQTEDREDGLITCDQTIFAILCLVDNACQRIDCDRFMIESSHGLDRFSLVKEHRFGSRDFKVISMIAFPVLIL